MFTAADYRYMARALCLAARGRYSTHPNPRVGCVLVSGGRIVGEGWHRRPGGPHAEVLALREAGEAARGAVCYVSLEPCCHHGRTPPCTEALLEAGVARVVAAMQDPNPAVRGRGLSRLAEAGVSTACGLMQAEAAALNAGFILRHTLGRPRVRLKLGASLDARTASANGQSQWITSPEARADVQRLRAESAAVMTGIGTLLADDPRLNVREDTLDRGGRQPLRVVVDSRLRTPADARVLQPPGECLLVHALDGGAAGHGGATTLALPGPDGRVDLGALMQALAARELNEVLVEAGPVLSGALLAAGLVDQLVLYLAPKLLGDGGRALAALPGLSRLDQALELEFEQMRAIGPDLRLTARVRHCQARETESAAPAPAALPMSEAEN